jgi:hypothetical protein
VAGWETVREIALGFPGFEESTSHGQPALKVGGKLFAWVSPTVQPETRSQYGSTRTRSRCCTPCSSLLGSRISPA